jgi:hypothetical protein
MMNISGISPWMLNQQETGLILPKPVFPSSPSAVNEDGLRTVVKISDAGRRLAEVYNARNLSVAETESAKELRNYLKQYDFHNISPNQMSQLGGMLFMRGEISQDAVGSFISVEMNFADEPDPDKPMDMVAHFNMMLDVVEKEYKTDRSFDFAVKYRQEASKGLADVLSFVKSNRNHISS